jgi:outer membrane protein assembly factor BamE
MRSLLLPIVCAITCSALVISGCSLKRPRLPRVHKLTVQQGNVITQEMIDRLKPGMTRSQVSFIMGEPVVRNSFNDDRWDYIYTIEVPGVFSNTQTVSLFFVDDLLAYFTGDLVPTGQSVAESGADEPQPESESADPAESG